MRRDLAVVLSVAAFASCTGAAGALHKPSAHSTPDHAPGTASTAPTPKVNTGTDDCTGATVFATYSPKIEFGLEGEHFSLPMFAAEAVRRNAGKPMRCVIVSATCRDEALSKQALKVLKPYGVTRVSWQPDRKLFPKPTSKMPECKREPN